MPKNRFENPPRGAARSPMEGMAHLRRRINDLATLAMPARWGALSSIIREAFERREGDNLQPQAISKAGAGSGFQGRARDVSPAVIAHAARRGEFLRFVMGRACWFREDSLPARFIGARAVTRGPLTDAMKLALDGDFRVVVQQATRESIAAGRPFCPGDTGVAIFEAAHAAGFAHSLEIRGQSEELCAGLYGLAQGRGFIILEIFASAPELHRLALDSLEAQLAQWRYEVLAFSPYARMREAMLAEAGFSAMLRTEFDNACGANPSAGRHGRWSFEEKISAARDPFSSAA